MKTNRLFDGGILLVIGIILAAIVAAGGLRALGDGTQRCVAYKAAYDGWVAKGKPGGAAEEKRIEQAYGVGKVVCRWRGVEI
jgi:hypothetical protein